MHGEFFYLGTSKYLEKYTSYEKNVLNKTFLLLRRKSDSEKIYPTPHALRVWGKNRLKIKF